MSRHRNSSSKLQQTEADREVAQAVRQRLKGKLAMKRVVNTWRRRQTAHCRNRRRRRNPINSRGIWSRLFRLWLLRQNHLLLPHLLRPSVGNQRRIKNQIMTILFSFSNKVTLVFLNLSIAFYFLSSY